MKINFKQPKYVLPVILLPFLCLFFYAWHSGFSKPKQVVKENTGLNGSVGNVSADVRKKQLADKLDAYRNTYKEADGLTAVNVIPRESSSNPAYNNDYSDQQKKKLDSIQQAMKLKFGTANSPVGGPVQTESVSHDRQVAKAIEAMSRRQANTTGPAESSPKEKDPMEVFKAQMAIMDSINKQNDPAYKEELKKKQLADKAARQKENRFKLAVEKADAISSDFNTVLPAKEPAFISAVIDENVTGYAGSRLRLKLLEDIKAGNNLIKAGTYLFAQISGFSEQRVTLAITSILYEGRILPVKLDVYDMDGLPGLYVPSSAFRDFTKDLGGNAVQGVTIDGSSGNSQFIMSSLDKVFQSTSSAIADLIRKNKAKLKYNSYIYLIDTDALQNAHNGPAVPDADKTK
ncbi:conjugative transposon protein TraM [Mucilaginibacter sp. HC2]|uniref:conjugative transposon protein TraM n=1 Tax=Mucilaginibacter TaxID=423349 RepID=UPI000DCCCDE3|nr:MULTISPECIES: conjugative transposon protein TraM [Mucilaginibacter]NHA05490.1 conjugative transposon protein TraM [Mucilaginibacter inviolabilis]QTE35298.1 conjugative transposon protein TraM [Mucilaginibacter gossypii]RAV59496.1 conjugative transposon protein TraM [Mucilaginibacter rubeus]